MVDHRNSSSGREMDTEISILNKLDMAKRAKTLWVDNQ